MKNIFFILILSQITISYSQCFIKEIPSIGRPLKTTGSKKLDKILSKEVKYLEKSFLVDVNLYAYDDAEFPNAYAVNIAPYTIILGKGLLLDEYVNTDGYFSIVAIMAHEFAHVTQYKFNEQLTGKYSELHADFLAGWYMARMKGLSSLEIEKISLSFWDKGDDNYFSENHHGTSQERRAAFLEGFKNSQMDIFDAFAAGKKFVLPKVEMIEPNKDNFQSDLNQCILPNPMPTDITLAFRTGIQLYYEAKFLESARSYDFIIQKYPDYCVAYYNRGLALYYSGRENDALLDFQKSFELGFKEAQRWIK
jgi:hypothetical protein